MSLRLVLGLSIALSGAVGAEETAVKQPNADAVVLAKNLPEAVLKRLRRYPASFIAAAADAILTYGGKAGLDAGAIDRLIAIDRAKVRAREIERLLRADLDNDLLISKAEFDILVAVTSAGSKGKLDLAWRQADQNANRSVDTKELNAYAQSIAVSEVSDLDVDGWRALLHFDLDASGFVEIGEVIAAVAALQTVDLTLVRKEI